MRNASGWRDPRLLLCITAALLAFVVQSGELGSADTMHRLQTAHSFCTSQLHYTQNMMENNYICLLTLTGFCYQYKWLQSGSRKALLIGSGALGLNLLTRLTTALDLLAVGVFLLMVLWLGPDNGHVG